jgi:hypothetical protein
MPREDNTYRKNLDEQDLTALAEMCANVARNVAGNSKQSDKAHALRVEWVRLGLNRALNDGDKKGAEESLKKRMVEFLAEVPGWMLNGV